MRVLRDSAFHAHPWAIARLCLSLAALAASPSIVTPPSADAYSVSCAEQGIECIADTGFAGEPVWGYPVDETGNNCTTYAAFRLKQNGLANPGSYGDAGQWAERAAVHGFAVDDSPEVGSIAHWFKGGRFAPKYGHVAYVERVTPGRIFLSDSNLHGGSKRWSVSRGNWQWPDSFLHMKDQSSGSISVRAERTRTRVLRPRTGADQPKLELRCPVYSITCVAVVNLRVRVVTRSGRRQGFGRPPRVLEIEPGTTRRLSLRIPDRAEKLRRSARRVTLDLRVETLGMARPTGHRLRLR